MYSSNKFSMYLLIVCNNKFYINIFIIIDGTVMENIGECQKLFNEEFKKYYKWNENDEE